MKKNLTIRETFALAFEYHKKNKLKVAENFYKKILRINPNHASAHNNLGLIVRAYKDFH